MTALDEHRGRRIAVPSFGELHDLYAWVCGPCRMTWPGHHLAAVGVLLVPPERRRPLTCPRCGEVCEPVARCSSGVARHERWRMPTHPSIPARDDDTIILEALEGWQARREMVRQALEFARDLRGDTPAIASAVAAFDAAAGDADAELVAQLSFDLRVMPTT